MRIQGVQDPGAYEAVKELSIQLRNSVSNFTSPTKYTDGLKAKCSKEKHNLGEL